MGIIGRLIAYFIADYGIARAQGLNHRDSSRRAQTSLSFGILVFIIVIGVLIGGAIMIENGTIATTPMDKDCKANAAHEIICTYTPSN